MDDTRSERQATLSAVVEIIQKERGVTWPATNELRAECEDVLERCVFDRETALAVLRGDQELDDDPWGQCPCCDCDTYFRMRVALERTRNDTQLPAPITLFVCESCHHIEIRGRTTVNDGAWWTDGTRFRARPDDDSHPYRGRAADGDDDEDEAHDDDDADDHADDAKAADAEPAGEWTERRVCPDGACIGLIGANGTCKVCGRAADA
jgi:hypothetical protein